MIGRLVALFRNDDGAAASTVSPGTESFRLAAAALLVEAATMDGHFDEQEAETIVGLLGAYFEIDAAEAAELVDEGRQASDGSNQLYGFTRIIKDRLEPDERIQMIEMLWDVACADGEIHDYEAGLMRRIAGLLYVSDRDSGLARQRAVDRRAQQDHTAD